MDTLTNTLKPGSILVDSWGYSMTLVDFYKVTSVTAKSVKVVPIQSKTVDGSSGYYGHCVPESTLQKDAQESRLLIRPGSNGSIYLRGTVWNGCQHLKGHTILPWDGRPESFNHMD
jgi:hypothetical protein